MFSTVSSSTKETNIKPDDQKAKRNSVFLRLYKLLDLKLFSQIAK